MKINIPNSWHGVTIREFQEVTAILKEAKEKRESLAKEDIPQFDHETECVLISTLSGKSIDDILSQPMGVHNHLMNQLGFLFNPVEGKLRKRFKVNGQRYYVETNPKRIDGGQFTTLMHFTKDEEKIDANLHNLLACFCNRRKWYESKGKYDGKIHNDVAADMLDLPITIAKPITDFFLSDYLSYLKNTARYLEYMGRGMKTLAKIRVAKA